MYLGLYIKPLLKVNTVNKNMQFKIKKKLDKPRNSSKCKQYGGYVFCF